MPVYQYICDNCSGGDGVAVDVDNEIDGYNLLTKSYLFFKRYPMSDKKDNPKCPKCGGRKTYQSYNFTCYIRGNGIVKDRNGARRDMNRHHLVNQDPYGHMRQSGEVDHMLDQIRTAGMDKSKINSKKAMQSHRARELANSITDRTLSDNEIELLLSIDEDNGSCYEDINHIDDVNKAISNLMYEFICKNKDKFKLLALGRRYVDDLNNVK